MEKRHFYIFFFAITSSLHVVSPSGLFEHISTCIFERDIYFKESNSEIAQIDPGFHGVKFICGGTNNEGKIFGLRSINCGSSDVRYPNSYGYHKFVKITFENCKFDDIDSGYFKNFTELRSFDVSDTGLKTLHVEKHHRLQLTFLNASCNQLTTFPPNLFKATRNLESVDISNNAIKYIDSSDFEGATNLLMINMSHNHLVEIPSYLFRDSNRLAVVDFSSNAIDQVRITAFISTQSLTSLNLSNNHLKALERFLFDGMQKLKYLNLSYNPIGDIKIDTLAYLTDLEYLDLRRINISKIVIGTFSFQSKLVSLDLSENILESLDFNLFLPILQHLRTLRLADNQLRNLDGFENRLFPQLISLDIKNNEFECDPLIRFMKSIDWNNIDIPVDPNAVDKQKTNIRGINCGNYGNGGGFPPHGNGHEGTIPPNLIPKDGNEQGFSFSV